MEPANEIGWAVHAIRSGHHVRRAGWNGKGMWIAMTPGQPVDKAGTFCGPFVFMSAVDGSLVPWTCPQTDLLATDWEIAE
jgi:hypothetical protein